MKSHSNMEISYWQSRWRNDKTGWHMDEVYPLLKKYWPELNIKPNATVLVPLCGKTLDIDWLAEHGHDVVGVDVSEKAIQTVIKRNNLDVTRSAKGPFSVSRSQNIELWCGDFMKLRKNWVPPIDVIYDKAALIALPPDKRTAYTQHIQALTQPHTQILLNCFEYDQQEMTGPPFSVSEGELRRLYGSQFTITLLYSRSILDEMGRFQQRGLQSYLNEKFYLLQQD